MGLMGTYVGGKLIGRDGVTLHEVMDGKSNDFGVEWQVRDTDPQLFATSRAPQWPAKCIYPEDVPIDVQEKRRWLRKFIDNHRRLNEISAEEAIAACAKWPADERRMCVFDVMASGDLELAEAGGY